MVALADALAGRYVSRKEGDSIWPDQFDALKKNSGPEEDFREVCDKQVHATQKRYFFVHESGKLGRNLFSLVNCGTCSQMAFPR